MEDVIKSREQIDRLTDLEFRRLIESQQRQFLPDSLFLLIESKMSADLQSFQADSLSTIRQFHQQIDQLLTARNSHQRNEHDDQDQDDNLSDFELETDSTQQRTQKTVDQTNSNSNNREIRSFQTQQTHSKQRTTLTASTTVQNNNANTVITKRPSLS